MEYGGRVLDGWSVFGILHRMDTVLQLRDAQYSIHPFYRLPALSHGLSSFRRSNNLACRKLSRWRDAERCRTLAKATHVPQKNRS